MDNLELKLQKKVQVIVAKLQKLECTLLGCKDDAWIMELLFEPGFHRCHLIEWMLSKLGYDIGKMSGPQNSAEERLKNLQSTLSNLGICQQNDVIKGTAAVKKQLEFWCQLVDIIWLKYQITTNISLSDIDEGVDISPIKCKTKSIPQAFEEASSCINKLCQSVNMKHLFKPDVQLLAPDVEREVNNISPNKPESFLSQNKSVFKIPNIEQLKEDAAKNHFNTEALQKMLLTQVLLDQNEDDNTSNDELNQLEEEIRRVSIDFKNTAESSFNDVYNDLKSSILLAKADEFTDIGPDFKKLEPHLEDLLQLKNSICKLETTNFKLLKVNSDLDNLISQETLGDKDFNTILKFVKDEN